MSKFVDILNVFLFDFKWFIFVKRSKRSTGKVHESMEWLGQLQRTFKFVGGDALN